MFKEPMSKSANADEDLIDKYMKHIKEEMEE